MSQKCSICAGPSQRRAEINSAVSNGQLLKDVAARHGVSQSTISRHRARCRPQESRSGEIIPPQPEEVDGLRKRLRTLERLTDSVLLEASQARDSELLLKAVKRASDLLEIRAKLQAELEDKLRAADVDLRTEDAWRELVRVAVASTKDCADCRAKLAAALTPGKAKSSRPRRAPAVRARSAPEVSRS